MILHDFYWFQNMLYSLRKKNQQKYVNLLNAGRTKVLLSLQTNFENIDGFEWCQKQWSFGCRWIRGGVYSLGGGLK